MVFEYATNIGYVNKSHYNNHNTYNINSEIINCEKCSACGESITPFICDNYNIDLFPKYVDLDTFEELAKVVNELKNTINAININTTEPADNVNPLEKKNELLEHELYLLKRESISKENAIISLTEQLNKAKECINRLETTDMQINHTNYIDDHTWENVSQKSCIPQISVQEYEIPLKNRFNILQTENTDYNYLNDDNDNFVDVHDKETMESIRRKKSSNIIANKMKSSRVYVNHFPERNVLPAKVNITNSNSYTKSPRLANGRRKTTIISASITRPIDMNQFNDLLVNNYALKRPFGGATASQLNHYVKATLQEDNPDTIIICAGSNNLTKKRNQTTEETANEIMEIVKTCQKGGVSRIFVSSITYRPLHQDKINKINDLLKHYAGIYNFEFIDNNSIRSHHIKNDGVHLNQEGIRILADNFLNYLNRPSLLPFNSIWN